LPPAVNSLSPLCARATAMCIPGGTICTANWRRDTLRK